MNKRIFGLILSVFMLAGMMFTAAFADEAVAANVCTGLHDGEATFDSNGFCEYGCYQPAVEVDGEYQIANAGNLFWLANQVNTGAISKFSAALTANITIPDSMQWEAIAIPDGAANSSVFDGNGHTITMRQSYSGSGN